jgi:hypothetical protein
VQLEAYHAWQARKMVDNRTEIRCCLAEEFILQLKRTFSWLALKGSNED